MATGQFDWRAIDLVLTAWAGSKDYVPDDTTLADIIGRGLATPLGHSLPVTFKSVAPDGTVQTNQVVIPAVPIGPNITWFTFSRRSATINLSTLIEFIDDIFVLPFTPNGLDVVIDPDWSQSRGWFRA